LVTANIQIQESKVVIDRMFEFMLIEPESLSCHHGTRYSFDSLVLKNVSFCFPGRAHLLHSISLELRKGAITVLLGESGSGKSTLLQIIQRFYQPDAGAISSNGLDWKQVDTASWRRMIGVVSQDVKIFNGSLLYNICLSDTEQDLREAINLCERIGLVDYFKKLPQGYLTIVGEDGINLSGGQRQLVAIARALFNKPQLLLLDEVTSSLDRNSENFILNLLKKMQPEISVFMITHRIQTARIADNIYILDKGTIAISGTPQELLRSDNFYSRAYQEIRELAYL
jgi:ATP-binding cassette subfamily B protein